MTNPTRADGSTACECWNLVSSPPRERVFAPCETSATRTKRTRARRESEPKRARAPRSSRAKRRVPIDSNRSLSPRKRDGRRSSRSWTRASASAKKIVRRKSPTTARGWWNERRSNARWSVLNLRRRWRRRALDWSARTRKCVGSSGRRRDWRSRIRDARSCANSMRRERRRRWWRSRTRCATA